MELEGCVGEGQPCVLLVESVRRAVGKKNGCLSKSKESPPGCKAHFNTSQDFIMIGVDSADQVYVDATTMIS